ncbi:T9SS type A sorting domain-containing protein [Neolewinella agarilytica]|uniref:T9SS type A sorting domain-containing protein n=1 Tax=Neolewinella agarilytica TaxID=478744 RepID=UPI002353B115|nr:T9SS type A sorting domain-containing protein [Neolewinella agarilytica]
MNDKNNTWRMLVLFLGTLFATPLYAQFTGGDGDGFTNKRIVQITIDGIPAGVTALFVGGDGDGTDESTSSLTLSGANLSVLFGGGRGDGFDQMTASVALSGQDLAALFGGGDGDGFDKESASLVLSGESLATLFAGGDGDGFNGKTINATLSGESLATLFGGGDGDGFDEKSVTVVLSGLGLAQLFGGGSGDGFDARQYSTTLSGQSLAALFGGGGGDGFDVSLYAGSIPLPLTLISFDAFPEQDYVVLKWVTEDEVATDFFTIEKTTDGTSFAYVGDTEAAGFSEPGERLHYEMRDNEPYQGTSFYRLKTTDFDGAVSMSHLVEVQYSNAADWSFNLFPNPNTGKHFSVRTEGMESGETMLLQVYDLNGKVMFTESYQHYPGQAFRFDLKRRLPVGSYLIRLGHEGLGYQAKILLVGGQ